MLTNGSLAGVISVTGTTSGITIWDTVVTGSVGLTVNRALGPAVVSGNSTGRLSCRDIQADPHQQRAAPKRPRRGFGPMYRPVVDPTEGSGRPTPLGTPLPGCGLSRSPCRATPYLAWRSQQ
jgi:hypothetical protein